MYLRTTSRRRKDGSSVTYFQLAENEWDAEQGRSVTRIIHNFGRAEPDTVESLRRVAGSILRGIDESGLATDKDGKPLASLKLNDAWRFGGVWVLEQIWKQLRIDKVLHQHARSLESAQAFERAIFTMVANRALQPYSKLYCWQQWIKNEVYLPSSTELSLHHLYLAMDFLEEHKTKVEEAIFFAMADLMNADVDLIFYDTTSLHFEVDAEDVADAHRGDKHYEAARKRGHSKNGRTDAPQIVVGLAVTREGLPVRSWVFPGNTGDVTTVERVKKELSGWRLGRCVFVGDAGMNSEENRRKLALGGGKYILASRMKSGDEVTTDVVTRAGRYRNVADNLRVKEVFVGDGERRRRYVVCHNPDEEKRQHLHREQVLVDLEAELASLKQQRGARHSKRACELRTSGRFGRYLRETRGGLLRIDRAAVKDAARYDGKWVITSNDDTLTAEDLALGYKQLMRVEECWRDLKSGLRMRPVYHWRSWRIHAHVTLTVFALLLERIAEIRGGDTWRNLRAELEAIKVIEYEHAGTRVWQTTELKPATAALLKRLQIPNPQKIHRLEPLEDAG